MNLAGAIALFFDKIVLRYAELFDPSVEGPPGEDTKNSEIPYYWVWGLYITTTIAAIIGGEFAGLPWWATLLTHVFSWVFLWLNGRMLALNGVVAVGTLP